MAGTLQLAVIGSIPTGLLKELAQPILATFNIASVSGAALAKPQYAFNPARKQYHSTAILRRLSAQISEGQTGIVGVCDVDLFTPDTEFVYGDADREIRSGLISISRLNQKVLPELMIRRAQSEAVHEVGHLVGLSHCDDLRCTMFFSRTPADSDRKGISLCNDCRHELARLTKA
jgi:archaemetzincin